MVMGQMRTNGDKRGHLSKRAVFLCLFVPDFRKKAIWTDGKIEREADGKKADLKT